MFGNLFILISLLFSPVIQQINYINTSNIPYVLWLLLGASIANLPYLFKKKQEFSPDIEKALEMIRIATKEGKLSEWQTKQMYINLINIVQEQITIEKNKKLKINAEK